MLIADYISQLSSYSLHNDVTTFCNTCLVVKLSNVFRKGIARLPLMFHCFSL